MSKWWRRLLGNTLEVAKVVAVAAVPTALLLTQVWYQYRITELGYEISEETERHGELEDEHRKLTIEATVESRSERLAEVGEERFGLEPVEPEQIIRVESRPDESDGKTPRRAKSLDETEHAALDDQGAEEQ